MKNSYILKHENLLKDVGAAGKEPLVINSKKYNAEYQRKCSNCKVIRSISDYFREENAMCNFCIDSVVRAQMKRLEVYVDLKRNAGPCLDCGENDIRVLEFDHINPKEKVCDVYSSTTEDKMKLEASKCVIRCIRCHRIKTRDEDEYYRPKKYTSDIHRFKLIKSYIQQRNKTYVNKLKIQLGCCKMCNWFDKNGLCALDFDHLSPEKKSSEVSKLVCTGLSIEKIRKEIEKCRLLCANCHKLHTIKQRGWNRLYGENGLLGSEFLVNDKK